VLNKTYQVIVTKVENKIVYYKETVECRYLGQLVRGGSTTILQNWSQIGGFQSMRFPYKRDETVGNGENYVTKGMIWIVDTRKLKDKFAPQWTGLGFLQFTNCCQNIKFCIARMLTALSNLLFLPVRVTGLSSVVAPKI
jgi:hypothetical protein